MTKTLIPTLGQTGDYEIRLLKVFNSVVECGGFSAAETELNIGRSTISIHIKNLEQRVGLKLCERGRSGFTLTDDGLFIYRAQKELFSSLEEFRAKVNALHVQLTGELKIVTSDTITIDRRSKLQAAIAQFSDQARQVHILLDVAPMADIERMILKGEADIGFTPYHRQFEAIKYTHLYEEECHLYCAKSHPLFAINDPTLIEKKLPEHKIVHAGINTNNEVREQLVGLKKFAVAYFYEARLSMVLSGKYLGFMPDTFVSNWVKNQELKALLPSKKYYSLSVAAIINPHKGVDRARDLFIGILSNHLKEEVLSA